MGRNFISGHSLFQCSYLVLWGMSVYEGIVHIRHPEPLHEPTWNYIVLACAALLKEYHL
jgi:hypothetical protein